MGKVSLKVTKLDIQPGTARTFQAQWAVSGSATKYIGKCEYIWMYTAAAKGKWIEGSNGSIDYTKTKKDDITTWQAPDNAYQVAFKIRAVPTETGKKHFSTTSYSKATKRVTVDKVLTKGYYEPDAAFNYDVTLPNPLSIDVTPVCTNSSAHQYKWCESFEVTWEFLVGSGGQDIWRTGESTTCHNNETHIIYTGIIPDGAKKIRVITKPTSQNAGVIAENKSETYGGFTKASRQVSNLIIQVTPHADRSVIAKWSLTDNDANLTGFSYRFESCKEGNWGQNVVTGDVDVISWASSSTTTVTDIPIPTENQKLVNALSRLTYDKAITYLMRHVPKRAPNKNAAINLYHELQVQIDTAKATTRDSTTKVWFSDEYTVPEGVKTVRVTVTPTSSETVKVSK